jgi:prepilin-type processing-associated H-X9-DG protein
VCYAGVHNDLEKPIDAKDNGVFFLNSLVRYDDVDDGASNTIFVGEKLPDPWDLGWMSGTRATLRNTGTRINSLRYGKGLPRPWETSSLMSGYEEDPPGEESPESTVEEPVAAFDAPPGFVPGPGGVLPGNPLYVGGFASQHPGGANFAIGDGSVRFLSETISPTVYANLANRHDGKLPAGF